MDWPSKFATSAACASPRPRSVATSNLPLLHRARAAGHVQPSLRLGLCQAPEADPAASPFGVANTSRHREADPSRAALWRVAVAAQAVAKAVANALIIEWKQGKYTGLARLTAKSASTHHLDRSRRTSGARWAGRPPAREAGGMFRRNYPPLLLVPAVSEYVRANPSSNPQILAE
jgi:hypothetical protein